MNRKLNIDSINEAMQSKGLNAASIAEILSVSREAVSKWFGGESFPRPNKLLKLALTLGLKLDQLVIKEADALEPVIAFRKRANCKTTDAHINRAKDMGRLLAPLVPFLPFDRFIGPGTLKSPNTDYNYLQEVAQSVRHSLGVGKLETLDFRHLIKHFADLQMVLVPVMWGVKHHHENALHIFLPESMTTWVYLNLDVEVHDFKFWMSHELGHGLAPDLKGEEAEDFADRFAGALLFPQELAKTAYEKIKTKRGEASRIQFLKATAEENLISPISVYYEINHYAEAHNLSKIDLGTNIFGAAKNLSKRYYKVSESLFNQTQPDAKKFIQCCAEIFDTKFFSALKEYLLKEQKGYGYIQEVLNIPLMDAKEIHAALV